MVCCLPVPRPALKSSVGYEGKSTYFMPWVPDAGLGSGQIVLDRTKFIDSSFILCLFFLNVAIMLAKFP